MAHSGFCEALDQRRLMSVSVSNGTLNVGGTSAADTIAISADKRHVRVTMDGKVTTFAAASVSQIHVKGNAGDDSIRIGMMIKAPAKIEGGAGNDTIIGGGGNEEIHGGTGNDTITSRAGVDAVYGEAGNDALSANTKVDYVDPGAGVNRLNGKVLKSHAATGSKAYFAAPATGSDSSGLRYADGVIQNNFSGSPIYDSSNGLSTSDSGVLVQFTYNGDDSLSGTIDDTDFWLLNGGFADQLSGSANGNFDYNNVVDNKDLSLINGTVSQSSGTQNG